MADEDQPDLVFLAARGEEAEDLLLRDTVERCSRFVRKEEGRLTREGQSDGNPLRLAAAELVGEALRERRREPDLAENLGGFGGASVDAEDLCELSADSPHRIEARRRLLRYEREPAAAEPRDVTSIGEVDASLVPAE